MTIDEAIEGSNEAVAYLSIHHQARLAQAVKLGEEALKREKANRENPDFVMVGKLPGETKE